jgi:hypothetical protein
MYIESSPVWGQAHSAPAFYFDFKGLDLKTYKAQIVEQIDKHICSYIDPASLTGYFKRKYERLLLDPDASVDGLLTLTELIFETTGKRSYLLIDEYDRLLTGSYETEQYEEIRAFETAFLSSGLKGNKYLKKALLTGVMRISHESMLSGLNNISTYDVFNDNVYTEDYGLNDEEVSELSRIAGFDFNEVKSWYNGIKINGHAIFNIYSMMSYMDQKAFECYWGKSGTLDMIIRLLNDERKLTLAQFLNGGQAEVVIDDRISLKRLSGDTGDDAFFSLLVQSGYLSLDEKLSNKGTVLLSIPNKELLIVWKEFILKNLYSGTVKVRTLFDNTNDLDKFAGDLEHFLSDRLSYHDLAAMQGEPANKTRERIYHVFLLGLLSAYDDVRCRPPPSNRESGDGRYDVLVERPDGNYIFEFKACGSAEELGAKAAEALDQIDSKRYGMDAVKGKRLIKIGVASYGKQCRVSAGTNDTI